MEMGNTWNKTDNSKTTISKYIMRWNQKAMEKREIIQQLVLKQVDNFLKICVQLYLVVHQNQFLMD